MSKFLDPKADLTFKKVFGEHKNLVMSLLNALLPQEDGREVESIEYLQTERDAAVQKLHLTVRQMKANGLTADVITKFTGMTSAEIERIC